MSDKPTLEELRENARTNYGITNADDLDEKTLQAEVDAIDKQAKDAEKEEAKVQRNADRASANSTAPSTNGASDGNSTTGNDQGDATDEAKAKADTALDAASESDEDDESEDDDDNGSVGDGAGENEYETPEQLAALTREKLETRAREARVEGDPGDKEQYPNKDSLVTAIEATRANQ